MDEEEWLRMLQASEQEQAREHQQEQTGVDGYCL